MSHLDSHAWRASRSHCSLAASEGDVILPYKIVSSAKSPTVEDLTQSGSGMSSIKIKNRGGAKTLS